MSSLSHISFTKIGDRKLSFRIGFSDLDEIGLSDTAWKVSKYEIISGPYFPVFSQNTGKYEPEITP